MCPLFSKKDELEDSMSAKVLEDLENVDDDLDRKNVILVKMASTANNALTGMDVKELPAVVFFDNGIPSIFEGE